MAVARGKVQAQRGSHCAEWTRAHSVDPIGTAGDYRGYLLVEWPKPWPRDIGDVPELAEVCETAGEMGIRIQAIDGLADTPDDKRHVVLYQGTVGDSAWFRSLQGVERLSSETQLAHEAMVLLRSGDGSSLSGQDVLICGHGQRDVCCGSRGSRLAVELVRAGVVGARVWRTSHTGGHRFAPTGLVLPDATSWAYLDAPSMRRVVHRIGEPSDVLHLYRGCAGFVTPALQTLERLAFADTGWQWLKMDRRGIDVGDGKVRVEAVTSSGSLRHWEGAFYEQRVVPVPSCVGDPGPSGKRHAELAIRDVTRGERLLEVAQEPWAAGIAAVIPGPAPLPPAL